MRIFVSYARVDKPTCVQVVDILDFHEVWYDQRLSAGQKWWKEIQNRLEWCEGFIYLVSVDSLESEYCRRELEIAQNQGKHIFPVLIEPDLSLPDTISHIQYLDLSDGLTDENANKMLLAIDIAEQIGWRQPTPLVQSEPVIPADDHDDATVNQLISETAQAMEKGEYERAIMLIDGILARNSRPRFIDVEKLAVEARAALEQQQMHCQMEREYSQIVELCRLPATRSVGMDAFAAFRLSYPTYDPENLANIESRLRVPETKTLLTIANEKTRRIPLLEWREIPAGRVRMNGTSDGKATRQVSSFLMAKYPVTNRQYMAFAKAPSGYANPRWWDYSDEARWWRAHNPEPRPAKYEGHDRPRENVTWFEARAFCLWLGDYLKLDLNLPTLQQRQRAIMGDDERIYPWGNTFDHNRCNTRENGLNMTTLVNRYPTGESPYGVADLAGNVWEWCADIVTEDEPRPDSATESTITRKSLVHGGAFVSPYDRCHVTTYFPLPQHTFFASIGFRLVCNGQII